MNLVSNTLEFQVERWDDPGEPRVGCGLLPSELGAYCEGSIVFDQEVDTDELDCYVPDGFRVTEWRRTGIATYTAEQVEIADER